MKKCPNCGQEIPKESNFCPYCMEKFVVSSEGESVEVKPRRTALLVVAMALVLVCIVAIVFLLSDEESNSDTDSQREMSEESDDSVGSEEGNISDCSGVWYDANSMEASLTPFENGGYELIIYNIEDNKILFSLLSYQTPPASRIAQIEYIEADIDDSGVVEFEYEDDGWGNKGEGQMKLGLEEVELSIKTTEPDENAMWSLKGDVTLKKSTDEIPDSSKDFLGLIGRNYYDVINVMELKEIGSEMDEYSGIRHYLENNITILEEDSTISSVYIDYSNMNSYQRGNFKFSESISGNSTYADIEKNMGEITSTQDYNGENITCFQTKETLFPTYLKVTFRQGKIQSIYYFVPLT